MNQPATIRWCQAHGSKAPIWGMDDADICDAVGLAEVAGVDLGECVLVDAFLLPVDGFVAIPIEHGAAYLPAEDCVTCDGKGSMCPCALGVIRPHPQDGTHWGRWHESPLPACPAGCVNGKVPLAVVTRNVYIDSTGTPEWTRYGKEPGVVVIPIP